MANYTSSLHGSEIDEALRGILDKTSERYAKGTVNGVPVKSGEPGFQDNAKYYSEKASAVGMQMLNGLYLKTISFQYSPFIVDAKYVTTSAYTPIRASTLAGQLYSMGYNSSSMYLPATGTVTNPEVTDRIVGIFASSNTALNVLLSNGAYGAIPPSVTVSAGSTSILLTDIIAKVNKLREDVDELMGK